MSCRSFVSKESSLHANPYCQYYTQILDILEDSSALWKVTCCRARLYWARVASWTGLALERGLFRDSSLSSRGPICAHSSSGEKSASSSVQIWRTSSGTTSVSFLVRSSATRAFLDSGARLSFFASYMKAP